MSNNVIDLKQYLNVYKFQFALPGSGEVINYKPITIGQMKTLLAYSGKSKYVIENALDRLIQTSVQNDDFDVKELYLNDRIALLVELRKATKGSTYTFVRRCPECKSDMIINLDLNDLNIDHIPKELDTKIEFSLGINVDVDYIKRKDQIEVSEFVYKNKKNVPEEEKDIDASILTLASSIKKIYLPDENVIDEPTMTQKDLLINSLDEKDYQKFIDWFEKNKFGFDFKYKARCMPCGMYEEEINVPIEDFFL